MLFWAGILIGIFFAWAAAKMGFYETWAMLFNTIISIYLAIYLRPTIADTVPAAGNSPYGDALVMIAVAIVFFLILHGMSYTFFTGQFTISFPRIFDTLGAGLLGFLGGFLVWSFICFLIWITPISQNNFVKEVGFGAQSEQRYVAYISRCCNLVNRVVASHNESSSTEAVLGGLLKGVEKKESDKLAEQSKPAKPAEPNDMETGIVEKEPLGPPPEADIENI